MCANAIAVSEKEGRLLIPQNPRKSLALKSSNTSEGCDVEWKPRRGCHVESSESGIQSAA